MQDALIVAGHVLIGALFVIGGIRHAFIYAEVLPRMAARVPAPKLLLVVGSAFEVVAGAALAMQLFMPWPAWGLVGFTVAATWIMLDFWNMPPGPMRDGITNAATANLAIIGGLVLAAAHASG